MSNVKLVWATSNGGQFRYSNRKPDQPVCKCGKGWGSKFDGVCTACRGFTAWAAKQSTERKN